MGGAGLRYIGEWGALGPKARGLITYSLASFELKPFAGLIQKAPYNVLRRFFDSVLDWAPGLLTGYGVYSIAKAHHDKVLRKDPAAFIAAAEAAAAGSN